MDQLPVLNISNSKFSFFLLLIIITTLFVQGCTSPTKQQIPSKVNQLPQIKEQRSSSAVTELFEQIKASSPNSAIPLLLQVTSSYIEQGETNKALYICQQLAQLPLSDSQHRLNKLHTAQALYLLEQYDLAQQQLSELAGNSSQEHKLRANLAIKQDLPVIAITSLLHYYQQNAIVNDAQITQLMSLIAQLTPYQKASLQKINVAGLTPWLSFNDIVAKYAQKPISLDFQLKRWQSQYPIHPLNSQVSAMVELARVINLRPKFQKIAVIIPLSGREKSLGKTLQSGILAANNFSIQQELIFFDSNSTPMTEILSSLQVLQPDAVIGPLLKSHVKSYLEILASIKHENAIEFDRNIGSAASEQPSVEPHEWTSLLLNVPEQTALTENQYALSMLPEEEAIQAAFTLSKKGYKKALVLSQDTNIGKRMANSFSEQWQRQTGVMPAVIYYPNGKMMQQSVKSGLDVNFSDRRIAAMKSKMKEPIETETRNRRDIDVIYIFSTSNQAKLLKPYIDVNISPFANNISIYASSRSNNDSQNKNTRRDLNGLTFTEIPWLLSGKQTNTELFTQARQIWPKRKNSLERIYAMGIDSLQVLNRLYSLDKFKMLRHQGETGTLQMEPNHILGRSLNWGRFRSSRVQTVEIN